MVKQILTSYGDIWSCLDGDVLRILPIVNHHHVFHHHLGRCAFFFGNHQLSKSKLTGKMFGEKEQKQERKEPGDDDCF